MFGIKNSAFSRNLSPWARSRAEKSHQTFRSLRLGEVPFRIIFLENAWCHRNQRSKEQYFTQGHGKIIAFYSVFRFLKIRYFRNWEPKIVLKQLCIYSDFDIYILHWILSYGSQFPKKLNFKKWKTLENAIVFPWPWVKYCSVQRWSRWYQSFSKKLILKGTSPSLKLRNVWCDFSVLERVHGLIFRGKALFLMPNTMTEKIFQYSKILVNLGIKFESHL